MCIRAIQQLYRTDTNSTARQHYSQRPRMSLVPLSGELTRLYALPMRTTLAEVASDLAPCPPPCRVLAPFPKAQPHREIPARRSRRQRKTLAFRSNGDYRSTVASLHSTLILSLSRNNTLLFDTPMLCSLAFTSSHLRPGPSGFAAQVLMNMVQPSLICPPFLFNKLQS